MWKGDEDGRKEKRSSSFFQGKSEGLDRRGLRGSIFPHTRLHPVTTHDGVTHHD